MSYIRGNLAEQRRVTEKYSTRKQVRPKPKAKARTLPRGEKLTLLVVVTIVFVVLCLIQFYSSKVYSINLKTLELSRQYDELAIEIEELNKNIETANNPQNIVRKAQKLGLVPLENESIIFVEH